MSAVQRRGVLLAVVVLLGIAVMPPAAGTSFAQTDDESPDPDRIVLTINLPGDDRGVWTIEHRYRLENETDRQAFDELAADIEADDTAYVDRFVTRMNGTVSEAASATGREMAMENVTIETQTRSLPQEYGIVRYRFTWHGFATADNEHVEAGDAIAGLFLDEETSLQIRWADGYELASVQPTPDQTNSRSVHWRGPAEFGGDEPRIQLRPAGDGGTGAPGLPPSLMLLSFVALVLLVGGGAWFIRRDSDSADETPSASDSAPAQPEEELLSNEEQVVQLLAERGGRMKQQEVVEALGWTDAKTSQVVSTLREDGEIESFRLGRENVLRLPDVDDKELP